MPISISDAVAARRIRRCFRDAGYHEESIANLLGLVSPIRLDGAERSAASHKLKGHGRLATLLRLFFIELEVPREEFVAEIAEADRVAIAAAGLVRESPDTVCGRVLMVPVDGLLIAGDRYHKLAGDEHAEHVLSVNPPARFLVNMTIRKPVRRILDLCTGNGIQALAVAPYATRVVATDLNARALDFARFNLALNGCGNVELREGSLFEPVAGERFDQIVCNPPYILTPSERFMCTDNSAELDTLCEELVRESPAYLEEGGLLQMICEWVEFGDQDWRRRLAGWFEGSGCDAWVVCSGTSSVADYAARRRRQTLVESDPEQGLSTEDWVAYFRARSVVAIRSGFIQLRRRRGRNWRSFTSLGGRANGYVGDSVAEGFRSRDAFIAMPEEELMARRPRPQPDLQVMSQGGGEADPGRLLSGNGLPVSFSANGAVISMIRLMDGSRTLAEVCDSLAVQSGVDPGVARRECCQVVRELLSQGLLRA